MKKLLICILILSFGTAFCADQEPHDNLAAAFWEFITPLVQNNPHDVQPVINHLINLGFDEDSPSVEMLQEIQHELDTTLAGKLFEQKQVGSMKQYFIERLAETQVKLACIMKNGEFSEDTKQELSKGEVQMLLSEILPGLLLPQDPKVFDLKEFLLLNKSVAVPDYKLRIYALMLSLRCGLILSTT